MWMVRACIGALLALATPHGPAREGGEYFARKQWREREPRAEIAANCHSARAAQRYRGAEIRRASTRSAATDSACERRDDSTPTTWFADSRSFDAPLDEGVYVDRN